MVRLARIRECTVVTTKPTDRVNIRLSLLREGGAEGGFEGFKTLSEVNKFSSPPFRYLLFLLEPGLEGGDVPFLVIAHLTISVVVRR